jgi:hypothetical protein
MSQSRNISTILVAAITVTVLPLLTPTSVVASAVRRLMFLILTPICAAGAAVPSHIKHQFICPWLFISHITFKGNHVTG